MSRLVLTITLSTLMIAFSIGLAGAKVLSSDFMLAKAGFQQCVEECGMDAKKCYDKCKAAGQGLKCEQKCSDIQNKCHKKCHQLHD